MLESPLIDELVMEKYGDLLTEKTRQAACETAQRAIRTVLETRFGEVPRDLVEEIESVELDDQLQTLTRTAAACPDLDAFRRAVARS
ncbi:MAG: hypothetical protein GX575_25395 [Candidatus Anammoximicrobium sp.]|nr:hypothetical protein [Candidatus Anammoximicrobium sp.]